VHRSPPPSNRLACRIVSFDYTLAPDGEDIVSLWNLEAPAEWIRLVYFNHTFDRHGIDRAWVAPTWRAGAPIPTRANGEPDESLWQAVRFNARGQDSSPLDRLAGEQVAAELPALQSGTPSAPMIFPSDWTRLPEATARGDGPGSLVLVRSRARGRLPCNSWDPRSGVASQINRVVASFAVDRPPDPGAGIASPGDVRPSPLIAPFAIDYIAAAAGYTVVGIGDSILSSLSTDGRVSGPGLRACAAISRPERPVSWLNQAYAGRMSAAFHANGVADIRLHRPQFALIQCFSGNDPPTRLAADEAFARSLAVADEARRSGCVPIMLTAAPMFHDKPDSERIRQHSNGRARELAGKGFPVVDLDAVWGTGADPNGYRPEYLIDGVHPNNRACADLATLHLAPLLDALMSRPS